MNKKEVLSRLHLSLVVLMPVCLFLIFSAEYMTKNHNYIFQAITVLIAAIPWVTYFHFKNNPTIQSMMLAMDFITICAFILLLTMIVRFVSVFPEFSNLYTHKNILIVSFCVLASFLYGLYYGSKRWSVFFKRIINNKNYFIKNMTVNNVINIMTDHPDSKNISHYIYKYGLVSNLTIILTKIIGHSIIFSICGALLLSLLPIHIGSITIRRILFYKYIGSNTIVVN